MFHKPLAQPLPSSLMERCLGNIFTYYRCTRVEMALPKFHVCRNAVEGVATRGRAAVRLLTRKAAVGFGWGTCVNDRDSREALVSVV